MLYKARIRSYNGQTYGSWDASDNYFGIGLNPLYDLILALYNPLTNEAAFQTYSVILKFISKSFKAICPELSE